MKPEAMKKTANKIKVFIEKSTTLDDDFIASVLPCFLLMFATDYAHAVRPHTFTLDPLQFERITLVIKTVMDALSRPMLSSRP